MRGFLRRHKLYGRSWLDGKWRLDNLFLDGFQDAYVTQNLCKGSCFREL
jgi:hypothetical protein